MIRILSFCGKADRFEWWFLFVLGDVFAQLGTVFGILLLSDDSALDRASGIGLLLLAIMSIWAVLAVTARRLNERQRPSWLTWLHFVPVVGWLYLVVECGFLGPPGRPLFKKRRVVRRQVTAQGDSDSG